MQFPRNENETTDQKGKIKRDKHISVLFMLLRGCNCDTYENMFYVQIFACTNADK